LTHWFFPVLFAFHLEGRKTMNIYVGNVGFGVTEQEIRVLFEQFGPVGRASVITDRDTGQPRGFAFVEMSNQAQANQAITALNGTQFGGRLLNISEARPRTGNDSERRGGVYRAANSLDQRRAFPW
jgi:RNA recognition motif-containing protein